MNDLEKSLVRKISEMSEKLLELKSLSTFRQWIHEHEKLIGDYLKDKPFEIYFKVPKVLSNPLGAWHGDMVLVTSNKSEKETLDYLLQRIWKNYSISGSGALIPWIDALLICLPLFYGMTSGIAIGLRANFVKSYRFKNLTT
ncbi:MAG: hypothetical protein U0T81_04505 [Saprospiraceae bacterium]